MKKRGQEYGPDSIAISDVATALANAGVRCAVLNACRSAYTGNEGLNLASALIGHGLDAVVAMSYKIASSAVEIFVKAFYQSLFEGDGCFEDSSSAARAALAATPTKTTKFNEQVDVADSVVPTCIVSESGDNLLFSADQLDDGVEFELLDFLKDDDEYPIGRENDILLLENSLLLESNIGLLVGRAGSGKTKLLNYAASWWEATSFVRRTIWADLDHMQAGIDLQDLSLFEDLISSEDSIFSQSVVEYLRSNRVLIVFDGIESYVWPKESSRSQQQKHLKTFLRELHGGKTVVLLSSRKPEPWLDKLGPRKSKQEPAPTTFTRPLEGLTTLQGIQLATSLLHERRNGVQLDRDDIYFIEQLVKLVEGNPLALELIVIDFRLKSLSFENYFYALIEGAEMQLDERWLKSNDGARGVIELSDLIHKAITPNEEERNQMAEDSMCAIFAGQPIPLRGLIHAMSPTLLGMMWRAIGSDDLMNYAAFISIVSAASPDNKILYTMLSKTPEDDEFKNATMLYMMAPGMRVVLEERISKERNLQQMKEMIDELVDVLLTMGYLEPPASNMRNLPQKPYFRVHPLLTVVARTSPDYAANKNVLLEASLKFQTFCLNDWPHDYMYWNKIWDQPKLEISLTFINFYAALRIGLRKNAGADYSSEMAILMLMTQISKGAFADPSRNDLLKPVWAMATSRALRMHDALSSKFPASFLNSVGTFLMPPDLTEEERLHHCRVYLQMLYYGELCIAGLGMVFTGQLKEHDYLLEKILSVLEEDLAVKDLDSRLEHLKNMFDALKLFPSMIRYAASKNVDELGSWKLRERFIREQIQRQGVEEYPAEQKSWHDIPYAQNSMSIALASLVDVPAKIKAMASEGHFTQAHQLLQTKLDAEINRGGNQERNMATIYQLFYWLSKKEEKWLDAISHLNRANALRESTGELTTLHRVAWEGKLAKLYEKSGDLDTVIAYVKLLIGKANIAHTNDPAIEIACLRRVWKLDYSKRLDSIISNIFLIVRAALTLYRTNCHPSRIAKGEWHLQPLLITNASQPIWMFGATDPRPQTVAISFLLMMFGNLLNMAYLLRCQRFTQGAPNGEEKVMEIGLELEQRLFCPSGTALTYRHFSAQEMYEPQREFFDHLYVCGERFLAGELGVAADRDGEMVFPEAPFTPSTIWGNTATGGWFGGTVLTRGAYRCPTRIMLQMAGYMTDWPE